MSIVDALAAGALSPPLESAPTADAAMATPLAPMESTPGPAVPQQLEGHTIVPLRRARSRSMPSMGPRMAPCCATYQ
jgi:hypothetical protein